MRGFTLLETVIASLGALIIGTMLAAIMVNNNGVFYQQNSLLGEGLSLNDATRKIEENIRQAAGAAVGYPEGSPTYTSGPSVLVLKLPSLSPTGVLADAYDYAVVAPDSSNPKILRLVIFPDSRSTRPKAETVLTTLLSSIEFSYLDKNSNPVPPSSATTIALKLTVLSRTGTVGSSQSSLTVTSLRNISK